MHRTATPPPPSAFFIAGHLALDFINTEMGSGDARVECLTDDAQVLAWLQRAGVSVDMAGLPAHGSSGALHAAALELRETAKQLLLARKTSAYENPVILNRFLTRSCHYQELHWENGNPPTCLHHQRINTLVDLLVPVAEAIAELVVSSDFNLVKQCENPVCTLWFYDRTKSHQRRWCDMSLCGNRMKVAAFRAKLKSK
ncbi:MAG: ABATE domain-containing protein [Methylovulum miyakonense]|uniref:CGNR zinc finger domain-containing protein n=1 Tax=Methylovulum miyakonense TaxID=645578 RepID=UPI003BB50F5E